MFAKPLVTAGGLNSHHVQVPVYPQPSEDRYFKPYNAEDIAPISVLMDGKAVKLGVEICEDLWDSNYDVKVTDLLAKRGAELIVNISASF